MHMRRMLVLHGAFAGQTVLLQGLQFVRGQVELEGNEVELANVERYYSRCYQARFEEAGDGQRDLPPDPASEPHAEVRGEVQPDGGGDPAGDADPGEGAAGAEAGPEGLAPEGDGLGAAEPVNGRSEA